MDECGVKFQKKLAIVIITTKAVDSVKYLKSYPHKSIVYLDVCVNGVEVLMSILRRRCNVDHMSVSGDVRSKIWFGFKI